MVRKNRGIRLLGAGPENVDLFFDGGEVLVAGGQGGFTLGPWRRRSSRCRGVCDWRGVRRRCASSQGRLRRFRWGAGFFEDFAGDARAMGAPSGIVDFAPVDDGHEQLTFGGYAEMDELLDFARAGTVFDEETDTLKSCFDSGTLLPPPQPTKIGIIVSKERTRVRLSEWGRGGLELHWCEACLVSCETPTFVRYG